jgi:hypothetical protein
VEVLLIKNTGSFAERICLVWMKEEAFMAAGPVMTNIILG